MATLHFLCGKAGSGKTTLARKIAHEAPAVFICEDDWIARIADPIANLGDYVKAATRIRSVVAPLVGELLRFGVSVVFDFGGNTVRDRSWVRSIFQQANAEHILHYIQADDSICRARVRTRNETKPEGLFFGVVTAAQIDEVNRYFLPPGADE